MGFAFGGLKGPLGRQTRSTESRDSREGVSSCRKAALRYLFRLFLLSCQRHLPGFGRPGVAPLIGANPSPRSPEVSHSFRSARGRGESSKLPQEVESPLRQEEVPAIWKPPERTRSHLRRPAISLSRCVSFGSVPGQRKAPARRQDLARSPANL